MTTDEAALESVRRWVDEIVVGLDLCPFAARPLQRGRVGWRVRQYDAFEPTLEWLLDGVDHLIGAPPEELSTLLCVAPGAQLERDFDLYLDLAAALEEILDETGASQLVQLATFHPLYRFADTEPDDPANATNRAPFPTFHLLRVEEVEEAIARHPDTTAIPERNAALMRARAETNS